MPINKSALNVSGAHLGVAEQHEQFLTPVLNKNTVRRQEIIWQIDKLSKRGILFVHSPAGYGKTTAVALWAKGKKAAWLAIDEYNCDLVSVYKLLLTALSCAVPENFADAPLERTLEELEKTSAWPEAIIIDDFHLITDVHAAKSVSLIRARIPAQTALIFISRTPPSRLFAELSIKGSLKQISNLNFSGEDILSLFDKNKISITKHEAETIRRRTDGWAAALAAMVLSKDTSSPDESFLKESLSSDNVSDDSRSSDILNSDMLYNYLRTHVFDYIDDYHVLKKCSACDILNPGLCAAITGQDDAWDIVLNLADKTGLVIRLGADACRFHGLLKQFLESELDLDETIDKTALYKIAAQHFLKDGDYLRALDMTARCHDIAMLEEYLRIRHDEYERFYTGVEDSTSAYLKYILSEIPANIIKKSLMFSLDCFGALVCYGRLEESFEWIDAAEKLLGLSQNTQADLVLAAFNMALDPRRDVFDIPDHFHKIMPFLQTVRPDKTTTTTITHSFPFLHKSTIDYSGVSLRLEEFFAKCREYIKPVLGPMYKPLVLLMEAGVRYERGELEKAEEITGETVQMADGLPPELQFCTLVLHTEILRVQGRKIDLEKIAEMIAAKKAYYLNSNYRAFATNICLYDGDIDEARRWLSLNEIYEAFKLYKIYQYFTTIRALMVTGQLSDAEKILERLAVFSSTYRRPCDYIEALTLRSICLWHMKRQSDSVEVLIKAVTKAYELQLLMPVIKEGADILPVLQRMLNRLKRGYDTDIVDKSFLHTLFLGAQQMSRQRGCMVQVNINKPVKLSARQLEILEYLEQNSSYREIAEKIGCKVATVNDHINKTYEKLGVKNAQDAVLKARELGILRLTVAAH